MENIFITKIHVGKVRHLQNFDIEVSDKDRKHLILTGKNGSGKTSLLEQMSSVMFDIGKKFVKNQGIASNLWEIGIANIVADDIKNVEPMSLNIIFSGIKKPYFTRLYIPAKRSLNMHMPKNIEKVDIKDKLNINADLSRDFLKYIIYLDYQRLRAKTDEDRERLQKWFDRFESALKDIYNCPELHLEPIPDDLLFKVTMPGIESFGLNEMADGYSAFLDIIIELMLRMDNGSAVVDTDLPGIVLIDEIETHLHIELQKKVLPFLTKMFPNIQFIVSTHSPFVISSISNAVVFDLENKRRVEDLSAYSWETIVECYFEAGQYSHVMTEKFNRYRELYHKERSHDEEKDFLRARAELSTIISPAQKELYNAFSQMELNLSGKAAK